MFALMSVNRLLVIGTAAMLLGAEARELPALQANPVAAISRPEPFGRLLTLWHSPLARGRNLIHLAETTNQYGEVGMRVLLSVVRDAQMDTDIRLHALWSLSGYWSPWNSACTDHMWFDGMRGWLYDYCWFNPRFPEATPGDDAVLDAATNVALPSSGVLRMLSLRPEARDTMRAQLRLVLAEKGRMGEAVGHFLGLLRWSQERDPWIAGLCSQYERDLPLAKSMHRIRPVEHYYSSGIPGWCTTTGPKMILDLWQYSGNDPAVLPGLFGVSIKMRDRRLHDGMLALARDARAPLRKREAALLAFASYIHEGMSYVAFRRLEDSTRTASLRCTVPARSNAIMPQESGSQSLGPGARERDLVMLREFARHSRPAEFREMATNILSCTETMLNRLPQTQPYPWLNADDVRLTADTTRVSYQEIANAECMKKDSALMGGAPNSALSLVLSQLAWCPDAGPVLTARRWRSPPTDSDMLNAMVRYGVSALDLRIFEAVLEVAGDRARPRIVRVAALRVLFNYATRLGAPSLSEAFEDTDRRRRVMITGFEWKDQPMLWGTQPVLAARQRVMTLLAELESEQGPDDFLRLAARELAQHIRTLQER